MKILFINILLCFIFTSGIYASTYQIYKKQYDSGQKKEAIAGFKTLIRQNPRHENIADMEYIIAQNEENYMRSIALFTDIYNKRKIFSLRDEVGFTIGSLYLLQNGFVSALNIFKDVKKNYPKSKYAVLSSLKIASINLKLKNIDAAINEYEEVISKEKDTKNPQYYEALFGLANCYFEKEQYYQALGTYSRLLAEDKTFSERAFALYRMGLCYEHTNKKNNAIDTYKMIISVYPNTHSKVLATQRLIVHEASEPTSEKQKANTTSGSTKPTIYETNNKDTYQMGRFRSREKASSLVAIIDKLGYNAYITPENDSYVVRVSIYDDPRNIEAMRASFNKENIPFFKVK